MGDNRMTKQGKQEWWRFALMVLCILFWSCAEADPCPGTWMTFFVDEQEQAEGAVVGGLCAEGAQCLPIPGFWYSCPRSDSNVELFCGNDSAWLCLGQGNYSYELFGTELEENAFDSGQFTMPAPGLSGCRARVFMNNEEIRIQTLTCIPEEEETSNQEIGRVDGRSSAD